MNLTFVSDIYLPSIGGLEIAVNNLSKGLSKKRHHLNIITQRYPTVFLENNLKQI